MVRNSTAAAVSEHFGYPVFTVAAALWIAPRSPLAWLLCVSAPRAVHHRRDRPPPGPGPRRRRADLVLGFLAAWQLPRNDGPPAAPARDPLVRAVALAVGYALAVDLADAVSSERVSLTHPSLASGVPLMIVTAAVVSRRA